MEVDGRAAYTTGKEKVRGDNEGVGKGASCFWNFWIRWFRSKNYAPSTASRPVAWNVHCYI